jgi:tetratricopeptide (TPR) repeat protein
MEAGGWRIAASSLLHKGLPEEAHEILQKAWEAISEADDELETGRIHAQAWAIYLAIRDHEHAQTHFDSAKEIFEHLGAVRDLKLLDPPV